MTAANAAIPPGVKGALDDAFQFAERDGSRHSYVTREWVEALLATCAAATAAAERESIIALAREKQATYWVGPDDHPAPRRPFALLLQFGEAPGP
jgi:hypothetical protein